MRVVYALPWVEVPRDQATTSVAYSAEFLRAMNLIMPVVTDQGCGIMTDSQLFSDTPLHLSSEGAALRSERLGRALAQGGIASRGAQLSTDCTLEPRGRTP